MLVALALGWSPDASPAAIVVVPLLVLLGTAAFSGFALLLAGTLRAEATLAAANLIYVVLLGIGGVVFPLTKFPRGARPLLELLPTGALSTGLRDVLANADRLPGQGRPHPRRLGGPRHRARRPLLPVGVRAAQAGLAGAAGPGILPAGLVLAGAVSVQSGAGIADRLFSQLPPASVTTLRLWSAALILLIVAGRSTARAVAGLAARRAWTDAVITLTFGIALGFMNFAIYQAFARIPLGIAVTIEFLGPLSVTVTGTLPGAAAGPRSGRRRRGRPRLRGARRGRRGAARGHGRRERRLNWAGIAWAAAAGTAWAAYILGSKAAGQRLPGASGLVIAMCVAAIAVTAPGVVAGAPKMFRPSFLAAGAGIGLLSSVIPYWLELEALRRIPTSLFGVWMSVQPAVAALIGLVVLAPAPVAGRVGRDRLRRRGVGGRGRRHTRPRHVQGTWRRVWFPGTGNAAISVRDRTPNLARMRET